jgi:hypothetical protein
MMVMLFSSAAFLPSFLPSLSCCSAKGVIQNKLPSQDQRPMEIIIIIILVVITLGRGSIGMASLLSIDVCDINNLLEKLQCCSFIHSFIVQVFP